MLESVSEDAFAIVSEGIYFIPRPDSAGRYSIQFFNFATKKIRSISTIESPIELTSRFPPMADGSYTRRSIRRAAI